MGSGLRAGRCKRPIRSVVLGFRHSVVVWAETRLSALRASAHRL